MPLRGLKAARSLSPSVASGNDTMAKRRRVDQTKGIFCLEGNWFGTKDRTTIEPVLRLLETANDLRVPYVHFDVATREELEFRLKEWGKASFRNYPILYLAFHGNPGEIELGQANGGFKLKDLATRLEGVCNGRIIHFGSCSTLDLHGNTLNRMLHQTKALALCGYKSDVDWLSSSAFDLLFLAALQEISFTAHGLKKLDRLLNETALGLRRELDFRIHYTKPQSKGKL